MNIWPQSRCKSHSKSSRTYIIHWRCPLKNALNAGEMMLVYVTWPRTYVYTTMMIRFVANLRAPGVVRGACIWLGLAHAHTHREIVLMPKYGDSIKLEIKFYNSGDSFPYLHFWTHFSFFFSSRLNLLGRIPKGLMFFLANPALYRIRNGDLHTDFQGLAACYAAAAALALLPHLLNVVASQS